MEWLLILFVLLLLGLIITLCVYLVHSGILHRVVVSTSSHVINEMAVAYKFHTGPYKECGFAFTETMSLAPKKTAVGIYYDDPEQVPAAQQRYVVGCIVSSEDGSIDEESWKVLKENGFLLKKLPAPAACVYATFPFTTDLSIILAIRRVYPVLRHYLEEHSLTAVPALEVYEGRTIKFVIPLDHMESFYVPESLVQVPPRPT